MWIVSAVMFASSDFLLKAVEGATSFEDSSCIVRVGLRTGREEVDSSCSWVAILRNAQLTSSSSWFVNQVVLRLPGGICVGGGVEEA